ncbi:hypothetical protein C8R43DRAFT_946364 [Mycena crocata]|nr:hypothetical protein C8R43DRAFT_946364 [Mycena crocata]
MVIAPPLESYLSGAVKVMPGDLQLEGLLGDTNVLPFADADPQEEIEEKQIATAKTPPQDLSLFPQMHIDILLEVLGHLHPIDLIHVARVNKTFRDLLRSPVTTSIWRSSFLGSPPLPPCPDQIPGRRWAKLLFGPRECDECGQPDTSPDYRIWRHLCTDCMDSKLCNGVPNYPSSHVVNALVAQTFRLEGSSGAAHSDVGRVWPADGAAVAEEYDRLKRADEDENASDSVLASFVEARKAVVKTTEDLADEAQQWAEDIFNAWLRMTEERHQRVYMSARKRLIQEGYDRRDVDSAQGLPMSPFLRHIPRLTSKHWNKARPHLLPLIDDARVARLKHEHAQLVARRTQVALFAASRVLRTAPHETWAYSPPHYTIETFPPLRELTTDPSDAPLAEDDPRLADALSGLLDFVKAWGVEKRLLLASLLPSPGASTADDPPNPRRLALATSVFTCLGSWMTSATVTAGRSLIGWEGAGAHLRCRSLQRFWEHRPHFAPEGAAAARELVRLVGLDPATATAAEMDRMCGDGSEGAADKRFLCALCPVEGYKRVRMRGRPAMRWRECVQHTIERTRLRTGDAAHGAPAWVLLTEEGVKDVRRREGPDPAAQDNAWLCTLCTVHYEGRVTLSTVTEHVRNGHHIRNPVEGKEFIYFVGAERTPRVPALLSQDGHVAEYRCNRCPQGKLRSLRAVGRHIADKHEVASPSEDDWTRVQRILRRTPMPVSVVDG